MINSGPLAALLLALVSAPLLAQPAPAEKDTPAVEQAQAADKTAQERQAPEPAQSSTAPNTGEDSPFDYRSSEEISEDVPVSFPVDI